MVKKLFALASVTVLTGLVLAAPACGGRVDSGAGASGGGGGGGGGAASSGGSSSSPGRPPPVRDPGEPDPVTSPGGCPQEVPITAADIGLTWVSPGPSQAVCTQQSLDDLKALFAATKGSAKYADIEAALGPACGACVFTARTDARWGMIIEDGANVIADNSLGACFGALSTAACGKARFEIDSCLDIACPPQECGTDVQACNTKALKGACKSFVTPYVTACPDEQALIDNCTSFVRIIEVTCGGGPDGGLDAGL